MTTTRELLAAFISGLIGQKVSELLKGPDDILVDYDVMDEPTSTRNGTQLNPPR